MSDVDLDIDINEFVLEDRACQCQGSGWLSDPKLGWVNCFSHFSGQLHPDVRSSLSNDPKRLEEEERRSVLTYRIKAKRALIAGLKSRLLDAEKELFQLELELTNRTITIKMVAIKMDGDIK